jgi:serine-type D-Ala-D-Ala carboxypeptidase (penicillin-binding protein 5/6)
MPRTAPGIVLPLCLVLLSAGACPGIAAPRPPVVAPSGHTVAYAGATARLRPAAAEEPAGPPSTLLMEVSTGRVLEASDPHRRRAPASLDKLMTLYLTLQALRHHRLMLDTTVTVSTEAWRVGRAGGGSRMFLNVGDVVTIAQLLPGLMVASGNDAAEALAEAVGGSAEQFVDTMNAEAARTGMRDTHFVTPHGLPVPDEYTSAWDMALLARRILLEYPDVVQYTSPQYETYAGIRQANWNNLVFRDSRVDGLKTGHTTEAGYDIVATAHEGPMRLIAVVMGARTVIRRTALAEGLFNRGFSGYALVAIPWSGAVPASLTIYGGRTERLAIAAADPVQILVARGEHPSIEISEEISMRPFAPVHKGQHVGRLTVRRDGRVIAATPLVAAQAIDRGDVLTWWWGFIRYEVASMLHRHPSSWRGTYTPNE